MVQKYELQVTYVNHFILIHVLSRFFNSDTRSIDGWTWTEFWTLILEKKCLIEDFINFKK